MEHPPPALSRHRLNRILGLSDDASRVQVRAAMGHLVARLRSRLESSDPLEADSLRLEITDLETSRAHFVGTPEEKSRTDSRHQRQGLLRTLLTASLIFGLLIAYAAGYRITRLESGDAVAAFAERAQLILDGRLTGATLRVLDSDREELLFKLPADGARIELVAGRYALDVSREDCPDHWTRSVYFEEGATHRFEPSICVGEGELTVRSNVARDRLRIDGLDLGSTRAEPHLLGVGDHEVRVEKAGYRPFVGQVRIRPGEELTLRAELVAATESGTPVGRPIPVERVSPASAPTTTVTPEPFDLASLGNDLVAQGPDLRVTNEELMDHLIPTTDSTGGGSTRWHDRVSRELLNRYDLDGSGQIDRLDESETISCDVWVELERDFDGGGLGLSMVRYYGFDGSEWHPNALGFAQSHRSAVFEKMKECGLKD
jgi:hypothetical protein